MSTLHIVEVGGEGGVFQHVLGAAEKGAYAPWENVVLHTSMDAEIYPEIAGLSYHKCMRWQRRGPRLLRRALTVLWGVFALLPHLAWASATRRSDWEIQGQFGRGFYLLFILLPRLAGRYVVFAPHNSFLRHGGVWEAPVLSFATALANQTVVYVRSEAARFQYARKIELRTLWQYVPVIDAAAEAAWRKRFNDSRPVVLFAGQLRQDKNPLLLIEAVNLLTFPVHLVFAGQDKGAAVDIRAANIDSRHCLALEERYLELRELVALMGLCDVVVCPYQVASQSGVAALANQLGIAVVVSSVGGLNEQATETFELGPSQVEGLARALTRVLDTGSR